MDDDSALSNDGTFERLVEALDSDPTIGMAGAAEVIGPRDNRFQRMAARQFPRRHVEPPSEIVDSDYAQHPCCALPRDVFLGIGGEREDIVRGLDPWLRQAIREAGYRVVLVPGATVHHPMPPSLRALCRTFYRNGSGSAFAQRFRPDMIYETSEHITEFTPKRSLAYRAARFPLRLLWALVTFKWLRLVAYTCYGVGYAVRYAKLVLSGEKDAETAASR
jgi:GT2 family glycosyltransferase